MIIVIVPWPTLFSKLLSLPLQCWSHCSFWKAACDDGQDQCLEVGLTNITSRWNVMTRPDKPAQAEASLSQCFCTISRNLSGTSLWRCEVCSGACARSHMCSASRAKLHTRRDESRRGRPNKSKAGGAAGWIWNSVWFMAATPNRSKHADVYKHTQTEERRTGKKKRVMEKKSHMAESQTGVRRRNLSWAFTGDFRRNKLQHRCCTYCKLQCLEKVVYHCRTF